MHGMTRKLFDYVARSMKMTRFTLIPMTIALGLALILPGCLSSTDDPILLTMEGTIAGKSCSYGTPIAPPTKFTVTIASLSEGAAVSLQDLNSYGALWEGHMTGTSSFIVTPPGDGLGQQIVVTDLTDTSAFVEETSWCFSFRCCSTATGTVVVAAIP